jgi:plasmanylethanolamine desaturase
VAANGFSWWLVPVAFAGAAVADFATGIVHWSADTWGSESLPVIGRRLLHPFRVHHVNPDDFVRRRFIDTNGDVAQLLIPFLLVGTRLPLNSEYGIALAVFFITFCTIGLLTNQLHQWAHVPKPPDIVRVLQTCRLILNRDMHANHHRAPFNANYCIATGWCNRPLAAIHFFQRLEWAITRLTGVQPRQDDTAFQSAVEDGRNHLLTQEKPTNAV